MPYSRDPVEQAAKYQVLKLSENEYELQSDSRTLHLHHAGTFFHFYGKPLALRWCSNEREEPYYAIHLSVTDLGIGHRGDEGWSSDLADNCFFALDGDKIRYVPLTELIILSAEQFKNKKRNLAQNRGETLSDETQSSDSENPHLYSATITHLPAGYDAPEALECTIGLPQPDFAKLVEGCISGNIENAYFHGIGGGFSASFEYGVARDLILLADSKITLSMDSLGFDYRLPNAVVRDAGNQKESYANKDAESDQTRLPTERVKEIQALRFHFSEIHQQLRRLATIMILGVIICSALIIILR